MTTPTIKCPCCGQDVSGEENQVITLFTAGWGTLRVAYKLDLTIDTVEEYLREHLEVCHD